MTYNVSGETRPKVVVVEDDIELANLFAKVLGMSYTVEVAHDVGRALEILDETVDVVVLDRHLPGGFGDEVLAVIREHGFGCRVAMVTAEEPTIDIVEMGFDEYLCKPVSNQELQTTVERLVAQANYGDAVTELYALTSKKALLEVHCSAAELNDSQEFAALERRIEELHDDLTAMMNTFSETQLVAEFAQISSEGVQG